MKFNPVKTQAILISNIDLNYVIDIVFNNVNIDFVDSHRHLGVYIDSECKWGRHIDHISKTVTKQLGVLRKLKFILSRQTLSKIYRTFILPILEYCCELWDGCTVAEAEILEKLQLEAGRIVTGLPSFSSRNSIYCETGWEPLSNRRSRRKLQLFYKIHHGLTPTYLQTLLPSIVADNTQHLLRNAENYTLPNNRPESSNIYGTSYL